MRTVGPKYGKLLNKIRQVLPTLDGNKAMDELRANGQLKLDIDGEEVVLLEEDLLIETAQMCIRDRYDINDAEGAIRCLCGLPYNTVQEITSGIQVRFVDAGHLLGSASIEIWIKEEDTEKKIVFSGDIGTVSYTHLDVYKRQVEILRARLYRARRFIKRYYEEEYRKL